MRIPETIAVPAENNGIPESLWRCDGIDTMQHPTVMKSHVSALE